MARPLRIEYAGALYHITSRGNERKSIFKDDTDRELFLNILHKVNMKYNWICHAYCLMDNHYHLVIETPDGNLSKGMRQLNGVYTQTFNKRHARAGHLFQGRYKAILIQKESHLLEVCRYVVLNPVRAKAVRDVKDWRWSSYGATAGTGKPHPCLTPEWILGQFAKQKRSAEKQYKEFIGAGISTKGIWTEVKGQSILGSNEFAEKLNRYIKGHEDIKEIPKSQRYLNRPALKDIVKKEMLWNKKDRNKQIKEAVNRYGYSQKEVADSLGLYYTTISRIVNDK